VHDSVSVETPFAIYDALSAIDVPPEKVRSVVQSLEHDMALFATRTQFNQLDQFSGSRFELLRGEIKALRDRLDQTDKRLEQFEEQVNQRFAQVDKRFDALEKQIGFQIAAAQAHIENRLTMRLGAMLVGGMALVAGMTQVLYRLWPPSG
jgi:tetrahydromethanopterin S-methyltransferase subunit G